MNIADTLKQLGAQMGLTLKLDANRACRLIFDGDTIVDLEAPVVGAEMIFLSSLVGVAPMGERGAFYEALLEANLFGRGTDGAVLSVDAGRQEVILFRRLDLAGMSHPDVVAALEGFIAQTRAWTERLAQRRSAPAASSFDSTLMRV